MRILRPFCDLRLRTYLRTRWGARHWACLSEIVEPFASAVPLASTETISSGDGVSVRDGSDGSDGDGGDDETMRCYAAPCMLCHAVLAMTQVRTRVWSLMRDGACTIYSECLYQKTHEMQ